MRIDAAGVREIEAAFAAAQGRTRAPIACVVAECSADYALGPTLGAAVLALAVPWPLLALTPLPAGRVFLIQLAVFAVLLGALAFTPARAALASRARRRAAGYRAALVQFSRLGLDRAPERNGVLLYVSLAERYVRVVADTGLDLPHEAWRGLIAELGGELRAGRSREALAQAAARLGERLEPAFPREAGVPTMEGRRFHML